MSQQEYPLHTPIKAPTSANNKYNAYDPHVCTCVCMCDADNIFLLHSDMTWNSFNPTTYVKFEATVVFPLYSISSSLATSSLLEVHPAMWKETKGCGIMVVLWHIPPFEDYLAAPTCLSTVYTPTGVDQCTCQSITQMIPGTRIVQIEQSWTVGLIQPCSPIYYPLIVLHMWKLMLVAS